MQGKISPDTGGGVGGGPCKDESNWVFCEFWFSIARDME